jgi:hypothetical protein
MVYNSPARWWIHMLQDRFKESGIDILGNDPIQATRQAKAAILNLATTSPQLQEKVRAIGRSTLDNPARIADMFLHPHELRWPVERWFKLFQDAGLELCGIFDRYGELDDLPNPLITPDQAAIELPARAKNHCFEGNLETIWRKPFPGESATIKSTPQSTIPRNARHLTRLKIRMPPLIWFEFEETRDLAVANRMRIWHAFLDGRQIAPNVWGKSDAALQRLSRLGAIMHDQIEENFRKIAVAPMVTHPSE